MTSDPAPRLYIQAPQRPDPAEIAQLTAAALQTGLVACVRLDLGPAGENDWIAGANHLLPVCHAADVPLLITDHFRLVETLGLDGVHLQNSRTSLREVRKALGKDRIIGAFSGASKHRAMTLAEAGADYVALGPLHAAGALGDESEVDPDLFLWWSEMIEVPSVAQGGITSADAPTLAEIADFIMPEIDDWAQAAQSLQTFQKALGTV